jgi:hypothetical protein
MLSYTVWGLAGFLLQVFTSFEHLVFDFGWALFRALFDEHTNL